MDTSNQTAHQNEKLLALYASPLRAGLAATIMLVVGLGLAYLPFYQVSSADSSPLFSQSALATLAFVALGGFIAFPGFQFARAILTGRPLLVTDGITVNRTRLGFGRTQIAWADVGDLGLRGVWVILMDGTVPQSKFTTFMFGARGLWIPAFFVHGGGKKAVQFITEHRPDLIHPVVGKVSRKRK